LKEAATLWRAQAVGRNCGLWRGVHTGAGLLAGPVTPLGTHTGVVCS